MAFPKPSPHRGQPCKLSRTPARCKGRGSFRCRRCGAYVCANHCSNKTPDYDATCGKCRQET